eukprot:9962142-Karenia_brevis.AAC.1
MWSDIQTAIHVAKFKFQGHPRADVPFIVQWIPVHAGIEQVQQGLLEEEDIIGNDFADELAKSALFLPPEHLEFIYEQESLMIATALLQAYMIL